MTTKLLNFTSRLKLALGEKMTGLLQIGSNANHDNTVFSDVDLILLGKDFSKNNWQSLRNTVRQVDFLIDIPVILSSQLPVNPDLFQMGTHGCYFVIVLKGAKVIQGKNSFDTYPSPTNDAVRVSLFRKISEYSWMVRRAFVESNRDRSVYQNYQINSRLLKMVKDLLWLLDMSEPSHSLSSRETVDRLKQKAANLFTEKEWCLLELLSDPQYRNEFASNMSEQFLQKRVVIFEKTYEAAFLIFNASH